MQRHTMRTLCKRINTVNIARPPDICACRISRWYSRGRRIGRGHPRRGGGKRVRCHSRRGHRHCPRRSSRCCIPHRRTPTPQPRRTAWEWLLECIVGCRGRVWRRRGRVRGPCLWRWRTRRRSPRRTMDSRITAIVSRYTMTCRCRVCINVRKSSGCRVV